MSKTPINDLPEDWTQSGLEYFTMISSGNTTATNFEIDIETPEDVFNNIYDILEAHREVIETLRGAIVDLSREYQEMCGGMVALLGCLEVKGPMQ